MATNLLMIWWSCGHKVATQGFLCEMHGRVHVLATFVATLAAIRFSGHFVACGIRIIPKVVATRTKIIPKVVATSIHNHTKSRGHKHP